MRKRAGEGERPEAWGISERDGILMPRDAEDASMRPFGQAAGSGVSVG